MPWPTSLEMLQFLTPAVDSLPDTTRCQSLIEGDAHACEGCVRQHDDVPALEDDDQSPDVAPVEDVVPLVVNGCCGNINPWNPFDPDDRPDHLRMGRELAAMSERIVYDMTFASEVAVDCESRVVDLPYREIPTARQQEVDEILAQSPEPPRVANGDVDPHWFRAASTKSIEYARARESDFAYEIQAFRIGDLGVVGLPGEPFVEGQLALKTNSAAPYLFPAHMTSHYVGYLPTREAYERGGHEANEDITYWAKLAPGCLEEVVDRARVMVGDLFV